MIHDAPQKWIKGYIFSTGHQSAHQPYQEVTKRYQRYGGYSNLNSSTLIKVLDTDVKIICLLAAPLKWALLVDTLYRNLLVWKLGFLNDDFVNKLKAHSQAWDNFWQLKAL